jgi:hypothetical protein
MVAARRSGGSQNPAYWPPPPSSFLRMATGPPQPHDGWLQTAGALLTSPDQATWSTNFPVWSGIGGGLLAWSAHCCCSFDSSWAPCCVVPPAATAESSTRDGGGTSAAPAECSVRGRSRSDRYGTGFAGGPVVVKGSNMIRSFPPAPTRVRYPHSGGKSLGAVCGRCWAHPNGVRPRASRSPDDGGQAR